MDDLIACPVHKLSIFIFLFISLVTLVLVDWRFIDDEFIVICNQQLLISNQEIGNMYIIKNIVEIPALLD